MTDSDSPQPPFFLSAAELRLKALELERKRTPEEVARISEKVVQRFLQKAGKSPLPWKGRLVALYRAMPGELNLSVLENWLKDSGCRLCYPRVISRHDRKMEFVEVPAGIPWSRGPFGIQEPDPTLPPIDPAELEVIFVPGLAFGYAGERMGRGAGFYDQFLTRAPQALRIAMTFDVQLFPKIEQNAWDQPVHWVLTESRDVLPEQVPGRPRKWFFEE